MKAENEGKITREATARETRRRLLDAAVAILHAEGPAALTLDALARKIGLTKGAVLHHFHTKEDLVLAIVAQLFEKANAAIAARAHERSGERAWSRTFVEFAFDRERSSDFGIALQSLVMSVVGDAGAYPSVMNDVRASLQQWQSRLEADGVPPASAYIVRLALDGLADAMHHNVAPPDARIQRDIRERLLGLVTEGIAPDPDGERAPSPATLRAPRRRAGLATSVDALALDAGGSRLFDAAAAALIVGLIASAYVVCTAPTGPPATWYDPPAIFSALVWPLLVCALGVARFLVRTSRMRFARTDARWIEALLAAVLSFAVYGFALSGPAAQLIGVAATTVLAVWVSARVHRTSPLASALVASVGFWLIYCSLALMAHPAGT